MKITGFEKLQLDLETASRALKSVDRNIAQLPTSTEARASAPVNSILTGAAFPSVGWFA